MITGGCGFIGSNLAHHLVSLGAQVTIMDSMLPGFGGNLFNLDEIKDSVHINFSDMRDEHAVSYLIQNKDFIFNSAGQISHIDSMTQPMADLDINCRAQLSLLEACRHHNTTVKIIYASTRQIYGRPQYLPVDEKHPIAPVDVNGINKAAAEWYHGLYFNVYGIRTVCLRLTNTYGPRQAIQLNNQGFSSVFIRMALQQEKIRLYGTGKQIRDFNYVDDVVNAMLMCAMSSNAEGKVYNLGHKPCYSLIQFVEYLHQHTGVGFELTPFPKDREKIDIGDYYSSFNQIKQDVGWVPQVDLGNGLKMTLDFFKKNIQHYCN